MFLQTQFILTNAHFTLLLLAALVCFAVSWLYFDAWLGRKTFQDSAKWIGFALLSLSFVTQATHIEQSLLETSLFGSQIVSILTGIFRLSSYIILIIGQLLDPLQPLPDYRKQKSANILLPFTSFNLFLFPLLSATTALLYIRRATVGLEFHLRRIGYSFFILSLYEVFGLARIFRDSQNIFLAKLTAPFNTIWLAEHLTLIIFILILGNWIWSYLIKRLETQLMMIFTTTTLIIFLTTTVFFTTTTLNQYKTNFQQSLVTNVKVLEYSLRSKQEETESNVELLSFNPQIISATAQRDTDKLKQASIQTLITKKSSLLTIVANTGEILSQADQPEKNGGSLSQNPLIQAALNGQTNSSLVVQSGLVSPIISIQAAAPIINQNQIVGAVLSGNHIDNAFVDGLKSSTNLDASIYANDTRSATTFISPDGKSRWLGIKETNPDIIDTVLTNKQPYSGSNTILNTPFYTAYLPILDQNQQSIGMLFVGQPQSDLFKSASKSIEYTFIITAFLLISSIIPSYLISNYIIKQIY